MSSIEILPQLGDRYIKVEVIILVKNASDEVNE